MKASRNKRTPKLVRAEPKKTGVAFTNVVPAERHFANQILLNGSGVAAGDVERALEAIGRAGETAWEIGDVIARGDGADVVFA